MKKLFYPAIFEIEDDGRYSVSFPDLQGCNTCGDNLDNAYEMAFDALGIMLSYMEDNNMTIPAMSMPQNIKTDKNQFIAVIEFDMLEYKKRNSSHAVKKTLTIPSWVNDWGIKNNVNFSQVLQDALINMADLK